MEQKELPEFAALKRRWRWLMNELHLVERSIDTERASTQGATYTLQYKAEIEQELNELDWVFLYFDRQRNGYHLTRSQWLTLAFSIVTSALLSYLITGGMR